MNDASDTLYTRDQLAQRFQVSRASIERLAKSGELVPIRIGACVRYTKSQVCDFLEKHRTQE